MHECQNAIKQSSNLSTDQCTASMLDNTKPDAVVIEAISCRLPGGVRDVPEFWDSLKCGRNTFSRIPHARIETRDRLARNATGQVVRCASFLDDDVGLFDARFFGISRSEAEKMDPSQRLILECVYECMENAGLAGLQQTGFFVGLMNNNEYSGLGDGDRDDDLRPNAMSMLGSSASILSGRLSHFFDSNGPAVTIDTACSSSLIALHTAIGALRDGQCQQAIVAGVNLILNAYGMAQRANGKLLAPDGICRSFDQQAGGYGRADGCVAMLIRLAGKQIDSRPVSDPLGLVHSCVIGHNGRSASLTVPNGKSQKKLLKKCLRSAGCDPIQPSCWETHGTGTVIGDAIELDVLQQTFQFCLLGALKTHFGHSEAAAGVTGLLKALLQTRHAYVPENGHYRFLKQFDDGRIIFPVVGEDRIDHCTLAGVSSFGIGGTNAMAIVGSGRKIRSKNAKCMKTRLHQMYHLCPISARNEQSLLNLVDVYKKMLQETSESPASVCSSAAELRKHFEHRAVLICSHFGIGVQRAPPVIDSRIKNSIVYGLKLTSKSVCLAIFYYLFASNHSYRMIFKDILSMTLDLDIKDWLRNLKNAKSVDKTEILYCCAAILALIKFFNETGAQIRAIKIDDDQLSAVISRLFGNKHNRRLMEQKVSKRRPKVISSWRTSKHLRQTTDNYHWLMFENFQSFDAFEYQFQTTSASIYVNGGKLITNKCSRRVRLPNYQFNREYFWFRKLADNSLNGDHRLVGSPKICTPNELFRFENQLLSFQNPTAFEFEFAKKLQFPIGICVSAILNAVRIVVCGTTDGKSTQFGLSLSNFMLKQCSPIEEMWLETEVLRRDINEFHTTISVQSTIFCSSDVRLIPQNESQKMTLGKKVEDNARTGQQNSRVADFYEGLRRMDLSYGQHMQSVSNISNNRMSYKIHSMSNYAEECAIEAMIQVACYSRILKPSNFYGRKGCLNYHLECWPITEVPLEVCLNDDGGAILLRNSLKPHQVFVKISKKHKSHNEKLLRLPQAHQNTDNRSAFQISPWESMTLNDCVDLVRQAVNDIQVTSRITKPEQLSMSFTDLGLDSLAITDLANRLNSNSLIAGVELRTTDLFDHHSIDRLAKTIHARQLKNSERIRNSRLKDKDVNRSRHTLSNELNGQLDWSSNSTEGPSTGLVYIQRFFQPRIPQNSKIVTITNKKNENNSDSIIIQPGNHDRQSCKYSPKSCSCKITENDLDVYLPESMNLLTKNYEVAYLRFDLTDDYPTSTLSKILISLSQVMINQMRCGFRVLAAPGTGPANAFAIGFMKSLVAEYHPRIRFMWDFSLHTLSDLDLQSMKRIRSAKKRDTERWLITGGLGGIGWQMAEWILQNRNVSVMRLLGRTPPNAKTQNAIDRYRQKSVDICAVSVNVGSREEMKIFFQNLSFKFTAIIHSAGCIRDALALQQTQETISAVTLAKCDGLINLLELCKQYKHPLQNFIVNSSISAILGNRGQCNYSAANAYANEVIRRWRLSDLPATVINWGNWLDSGMALGFNRYLSKIGFTGITSRQAMKYLEYAIEYAPETITVANIDFKKVLEHRSDLTTIFNSNEAENGKISVKNLIENYQKVMERTNIKYPLVDSVKKKRKSKPKIVDIRESRHTITKNLNRISVKNSILETIFEITGKQLSPGESSQGFMSLGMDSLKIYQFVELLQKKILAKPPLSVLTVFEHQNVEQLTMKIVSDAQKLNKKTQSSVEQRNNLAIKFYLTVIHAESLQTAREWCESLCDQLQQSSQSFQSIITCCSENIPESCIKLVVGSRRRPIINQLTNSTILSCPKLDKKQQPKICFMISGQGSQTWNMGRNLSWMFPSFRHDMHETLSTASACMLTGSANLLDVLYKWDYRKYLYRTEYTQPIVFCFAYCLAKLYVDCGVCVDFYVGHSVGELVAMVLGNLIGVKQAIRLVVARAQAMSKLCGHGMMVAVQMASSIHGKALVDIDELCRSTGMSVAAINSTHQMVLSGDRCSASRCLRLLRAKGLAGSVIEHNYAFHWPGIKTKSLEKFANVAEKISKLNNPATATGQVVSGFDGRIIQKIDAKRLIDSVRRTVQFERCISSLLEFGVDIWVEIGSTETLCSFVRQTVGGDDSKLIRSALQTTSNDCTETESFLRSLVNLQVHGIQIEWSQVTSIMKQQMIQTQITDHSRQKKQISKNLLHQITSKFGYLIDQHQINGISVIPAALIIALFADMQTASSGNLNSEISFRAVCLKKPIKSLVTENVELVDDSNVFAIKIDNEINCCCKNVASGGKNEIVKRSNRLGRNLRKTCLESETLIRLDHLEYYECLRSCGMQYGSGFNVLREIRREDGVKVIARIRFVENICQLIDGALQTLLAAVFSNPVKIYIPFEIDEIFLDRKLRSIDRLDCHAFGQITHQTHRHIQGDVAVYHHNSLILVLQGVKAVKKGGGNLKNTKKEHRGTKKLAKNLDKNFESQKYSAPVTFARQSAKGDRDKKSSLCDSGKSKIAVLSYAAQFANGLDDVQTVWDKLKASKQFLIETKSESKTVIQQYDPANTSIFEFNPQQFGISPKEALYMDPQQRVLLMLARKTIERAGISQLGSNVGVFIGISSSDFAQKVHSELSELSGYLVSGTNASALAGRIAYWLGLIGPAVVVDSACASFGTALTLACDAIRAGRCSRALVGASNLLLNRKTTEVLQKAQMLNEVCKVFDAGAKGYVRADGAMMLLIEQVNIEKLENRKISSQFNDVYQKLITIDGFSIGHSGRTAGFTVPSGVQQQKVMCTALEAAGCIEAVDLVEAHATGTTLGDPIELQAIADALNASTCQPDGVDNQQWTTVTSAKSHLGHCEASSGAASLTAVLLALEHNYIPAQLHFSAPNRHVNWLHNRLAIPVVGVELDERPKKVLLNNFGFSGTNVSLVVGVETWNRTKKQHFQDVWHTKSSNRYQIVPLSAEDPDILARMLNDFRIFVAETNQFLWKISSSYALLDTDCDHRTSVIIRRHTDNMTQHFGNQTSLYCLKSHQSVKFLELAFKLDGPLSLHDFAELCISYQFLRELFTDTRKHHCATHVSCRSIQWPLKLSMLRFLTAIGLQPDTIFVKTYRDLCVARTLTKTSVANTKTIHFTISTNLKKLCESQNVIELSTLDNINGRDHNLDSNCSFHLKFLRLICDFFSKNMEIDWSVLYGRPVWCPIPERRTNMQIYWPFEPTENKNTRRDSKNLPNKRTGTDLDHEPEAISNTSGWENYLYELEFIKQSMPISCTEPFVAINISDQLTSIRKAAKQIIQLRDRDDIDSNFRIHFRKLNCANLVLQLACHDTVECIIHQNLLIVALWQLLDSIWQFVGTNLVTKNPKPCLTLLVVREKFTASKHILPTGCLALMKALAAERPTVDYRFIDVIGLNDSSQIVPELDASTNHNEYIRFIDGERTVQRLASFHGSLSTRPKIHVKRILIIGRLTGIAQEIIRTFQPELAVVASRSAGPEGLQFDCSKNIDSTRIKLIKCDCTIMQDLESIFQKFSPIDIVIHAAGIVENTLIEQLDFNKFARLYAPKVTGAENLLNLVQKYGVQKFIAFSSTASHIPSPGQANYASANQMMEQIMNRHPNFLTINWGPWTGAGMLAGEEKLAIRQQIRQSGWNFLDAGLVAEICFKLLDCCGQIFVMAADIVQICNKQKHLTNFLSQFPDIDSDNAALKQKELSTLNVEQFSDGCRAKNFHSRPVIELTIRKIIQNVSGLSDLKDDTAFIAIGIDSLMIAEIRAQLNQALGINLLMADFYEHFNIQLLVAEIEKIQKIRKIAESEQSESHAQSVEDSSAITIIGYSGAFSGASDDQIFWQNLLNGHETTTIQINREGDSTLSAIGLVPEIDKFDPNFWGLSSEDASYLDPQIRKFVEHSYVALERSGLAAIRSKLRIAVVAGAEPTEYRPTKQRSANTLERMYESNQKDFVALWTSHLLNLQGPSFGVYSACSTGLVAVSQAISLLRNDECDIAIAGAVSVALGDADPGGHTSDSIMSKDGHCRPFDRESSGIVRGSAVGVVILEKLNDALRWNRPVIAKIVGYGISNDGGTKASFMAPNVTGQRLCMEKAIEMAGPASRNLAYIECHGTGTTAGDSIEFSAMRQLYDYPIYIGSLKANIGHSLAGAGIAGLIKLCKIIETRLLPRQINFQEFNEQLPSVSYRMPDRTVDLSGLNTVRLGLNSFGIGGTNVHMLIESCNKEIWSESPKLKNEFKTEKHGHQYILPVSAKSEASCVALCHRIADYLTTTVDSDLSLIASSLQHYREKFEYRAVVIAESVDDAASQLRNIRSAKKSTKLTSANIAYYFAAQGTEYGGLGRNAFEHDIVFRKTVENCFDCLKTNQQPIDLKTIMYGDGAKTSSINDQPFAQLGLFSVCLGTVKQLEAWGVDCSLAIGHSFGEYVAATWANVFDFRTALAILAERGRLIATTKIAGMLAVKSESTTIHRIDDKPDGIELCAQLSDRLCCFVGEPEAIENLKLKLVEQDVSYRELSTKFGYHCSLLEPILSEFFEFLKQFVYRKPNRTLISSLDGKSIAKFDEHYMVKHMRNAIRLDQCLREIIADPDIRLIVEIGPTGILANLLAEANSSITVIHTFPSKKQQSISTKNGSPLLETFGQLWLHGYEVDWHKVSSPMVGFDRKLPNYQFQRIVCWQHSSNISKNGNKTIATIYRQCWTSSSNTANLESVSVVNFGPTLIFASDQADKRLDELIIALRNHFVPLKIVKTYKDVWTKSSINTDCDYIQVNGNCSESYRQLASLLRQTNFHYRNIIFGRCLGLNCPNVQHLSLLQGFFAIHWIIEHLMDQCRLIRLIALVDENYSPPEIFTILGPIRELNACGQSIACCFLVQECTNLLEVCQFDNISSQWAKFSMVRCVGQPSKFETLNYTDQSVNDASDKWLIEEDDVIIVFGGFGTLGQLYIDTIRRKIRSFTLIVASRSANKKFEHFRQQQLNIGNNWILVSQANQKNDSSYKIEVEDVDLNNYDTVERLIHKLYAKYHRLNAIIHAAGQITVENFNKKTKEIHEVFASKIYGTRNILEALESTDIRLNSLILNSSLSAVLGLPGNYDYAAANIYLDELVQQRSIHRIKNVLCIQWTGIRDSEMMNKSFAKKSDPLSSLIYANSITRQQCEVFIRKCLFLRGLVAVSTENPANIVNELSKIINDSAVRKCPSETTKSPLQTNESSDDWIRHIWQNALTSGPITAEDNFFELGGNSLNGMRIVWEIGRIKNVNCKLDDLFEHPTFGQFVAHVERLQACDSSQQIPSMIGQSEFRPPDVVIPLTFAQENMFILRNIKHPALYNIVFLIAFRDQLCTGRLRKALLQVIAKQTGMRTSFKLVASQGQQVIHPLTESFYDLNWPRCTVAECMQIIDDELSYQFQLDDIPLRLIAVHCDRALITEWHQEVQEDIEAVDDIQCLIVCQHHIVTDGWSVTVFANELTTFYRNLATPDGDSQAPAKRLNIHLADFAIWQRSQAHEQQLADDVRELAALLDGVEATRIVTSSHVQPNDVGLQQFDQFEVRVPTTLREQIVRKAAERQKSVYTILLAGFVCVLRRFTDQFSCDTVLIGCPVSGRQFQQLDGIVGYFLNNIVVRIDDVSTNDNCLDVLDRVHAAVQSARRFDHVPFHRLVAEVNPDRVGARSHPIFEIFFNYRHALDHPDVQIDQCSNGSIVRQFSANNAFNFACTIDELLDSGEMLVTFDYNSSLYDRRLVREVARAFVHQLAAFDTEHQQNNAVHAQKVRRCDVPTGVGTIGDIIFEQSVRTAHHDAFRDSSTKLDDTANVASTYGQLIDEALCLADAVGQLNLRTTGLSIRPDDVVPICTESGFSMLCAALGVQFSGAAYVPIDRRTPEGLLKRLCADIHATLLLTDGTIASCSNLSVLNCHRIRPQRRRSHGVCHQTHTLDCRETCRPHNHATSYDAAYVIFTSGSTGQPKGVCVANSNLLHFVAVSTRQTLLHRPHVRVYHSVYPTFDVSCLNLFTTLSNGACLVDAHNRLNAPADIANSGVNFAFLPSALFNSLDHTELSRLEGLEYLFVGGQTPNGRQIQHCLRHGIPVIQIYGPTETTVWSLTNRCGVSDPQLASNIGMLNSNEGAYLVGSGDSPLDVAHNAVGELVIFGDGVARGYISLTELRNTFFTDDYGRSVEDKILNRWQRSYRTGDLVRKCATGQYQFLSRRDTQLKVRGFRVEPYEIERCVRNFNGSIGNVAVVEDPETNSLVLFIESSCDTDLVTDLRRHLHENLFHFMLPNHIQHIDKMPINVNGKIDRQQLVERLQNRANPNVHESHVNFVDSKIQSKLRGIWRKLLSEDIKNQDFFGSGGHSLQLLVLRNELREKFQFELNFERFYRNSTFDALAADIEQTVNRKRVSKITEATACTTITKSGIEPWQAVIKIRQTPDAEANLYAIHAISGSVYAYFGLADAIPSMFNVYAIEFRHDYPCDDLRQLAVFYAKMIDEHSTGVPYLLGHSLGGILAREVADLLRDAKKCPPFVVMLDSWCIGNENLQEEAVCDYLKVQLATLPNREEYLMRARNLTKMLRSHQFDKKPIKIVLLKAKNVAKITINNLFSFSRKNERSMRSMITNGWQSISTRPVDVFLVNGDHETMLHSANVASLRQIFAQIFGNQRFNQ